MVATAAVLVALIWSSVSLLLLSSQVSDGRDQGSGQTEVIVQARIAALKMRANETLTLVARGDGGEYEDEFQKLAKQVSGNGPGNLELVARQGDRLFFFHRLDVVPANQNKPSDWIFDGPIAVGGVPVTGVSGN